MTSRNDRARAFAALHVKGDPLVLYNAWDAGSAQAVARGGAKAIATGSWSVAGAHGFGDGEKLPLDLVVANLERMVAAVDLPVSLDFEGGYARAAVEVGRNVARVLAAGAVGINLEDQAIGGEGLVSRGEQAARIAAARRAADTTGAFVNARCDHFLKTKGAEHDDALLARVIERAAVYADAGAHGFFAPGLVDERLIGLLCEKVALPVNVLVFPATPPRTRLAELGVARISHGPGPWRRAMQALEEAAREAQAG